MDLFRSVFPEDPDESEVNRAMMIGLVTTVAVAGSLYVLSSAPRVRAWWNRPAAPTPTPILSPMPSSSGPTVANNRSITQNLPGAFVEQDGDDQDMSPNDFTKPFWQYTEQDVANMKAGWRKCLDGRAADVAASTEQALQLQAEARNARQTERMRVTAEARRADAAETRADAAEARAAKADNELLQHKKRFINSELFKHHPDDQTMIARLLEDKKDLQNQLDACVDSRRRSLLPNEVEELQLQLHHAQQEAGDAKKNLTTEIRRNRNISLRGTIAENIISEHGRSSDILRRLKKAEVTVAEQKNTIEQQRLDLEVHSTNAAEQQGRLDANVEALKEYKNVHSEQKLAIERQQGELEQCKAEVQRLQTSDRELVAFNQLQEETCKAQLQDFEGTKTSLEDCKMALDEARQLQSESDDFKTKLRGDMDELISEAETKDATIERLRRRTAALREAGRVESTCKNCKALEDRLTLLMDWQRSQQALIRLDKKKYADLAGEFKQAKLALVSNVTSKSLLDISKAKAETATMKAQRDNVQGILNTRDNNLKKLTNQLNELKLAKSTDPDCEERCRKLQTDIVNLKAATAATECEKCKDLQAEVERLKDYGASETPVKRVQQLMARDATIKALQQDLVAAKANADDVKQPEKEPSTFHAETEQLKIWLEEIRVALCWMLGNSSGEARVLPKAGSKPNELSQLLREVQEKCERAEAWENEVGDLRKELKESNLADCREEIETLKGYLAQSQADLFGARAPPGPLKADNKIRQIISLKQQVADLQSQLSKVQNSASATDPSWKAQFDAAEIRLAELTAKIAGLEAELEQAHFTAPVGDAEAQEIINDLRRQLQDVMTANIDARQRLEKCDARHAELAAIVEDLKTELKQTKQERDDCRDKDLPCSKQNIEQLQTEPSTVGEALAADQAGLEAAEKELETLRNAKPSGTEGALDADAQKRIRMLTAKLDATKVALGKSRTNAEEQNTKIGELIAQVDQLLRDNKGRAKDSVTIASLQKERDAAKSETAQTRQQATQEIQQAKNETEQLRAEATGKVQQAELQIQILQNATMNSTNQNGEIQRLQAANNDLTAKVEGLDQNLKAAYDQWNHWGKVATDTEVQRASLETLLETERNQLKAANAASVAKDDQIQHLKTQLEDAKQIEHAALADLHGEGNAVIDNLQLQLDREKNAHEIVINAHSSLRMRASDIEQERDALKQTVLQHTISNPMAIENSTLRQQVTDLQRRLTSNDNHANQQIFDLTADLNARDQTIAGLKSKYSGHTPTRSTAPSVPQYVHDSLNREHTLLRQEVLRLRDWTSKMQAPQGPALNAKLQDEQIRRVKAEDRYNKIFPQLESLRKQLRDSEDTNADLSTPTSAIETANLTQVIQLNNTLRADIIRNNARYNLQLTDLTRDRDQLLRQLSDLQRAGGNTVQADLTSTVRDLSSKNAELQAWKDEHEFLVQQSDMMAEAERSIAAAKGDLERARKESVDAGFGTRGTVRKAYGKEGESPDAKSKTSKQPRVESGMDEELFG